MTFHSIWLLRISEELEDYYFILLFNETKEHVVYPSSTSICNHVAAKLQMTLLVVTRNYVLNVKS